MWKIIDEIDTSNYPICLSVSEKDFSISSIMLTFYVVMASLIVVFYLPAAPILLIALGIIMAVFFDIFIKRKIKYNSPIMTIDEMGINLFKFSKKDNNRFLVTWENIVKIDTINALTQPLFWQHYSFIITYKKNNTLFNRHSTKNKTWEYRISSKNSPIVYTDNKSVHKSLSRNQTVYMLKKRFEYHNNKAYQEQVLADAKRDKNLRRDMYIIFGLIALIPLLTIIYTAIY